MVSGAQILTLEVLVFTETSGRQWLEAEITAIRERAERSTKEDPSSSEAANYPRQETQRLLFLYSVI